MVYFSSAYIIYQSKAITSFSSKLDMDSDVVALCLCDLASLIVFIAVYCYMHFKKAMYLDNQRSAESSDVDSSRQLSAPNSQSKFTKEQTRLLDHAIHSEPITVSPHTGFQLALESKPEDAEPKISPARGGAQANEFKSLAGGETISPTIHPATTQKYPWHRRKH
jgi:hypothetical protein